MTNKLTNKEAIKRIYRFVETYKICGKDNYNPTTNITKLDYEAFKTAIELLEQQSSDDCISRAGVLGFLKGIEILHNHDELRTNLIYGIKQLPSVTPQPKMGKWIIIDDCEHFIAKCSECGRIEDSRMINKYPYCHCGAKMLQDSELKESKD